MTGSGVRLWVGGVDAGDGVGGEGEAVICFEAGIIYRRLSVEQLVL